ncbi:MAG: histidine--tRNA ligase [Patescibacteria group bacterium]|nr:histidine--tRNA ligase [Patescibacteria group bacterium]MCL5261700.1 histidine--tRNA ligase [Patescibacteria group bacterium]
MAAATKKIKVAKASKPVKPAVLQAPKGMHDILPEDAWYWERVEQAVKDTAAFYGFDRIETPMLESVDLFVRGVGEATDIVEKEMYVLKTRGGDHLALRPEMTAPVMRAYIEHGLSRVSQPLQVYYFGPAFRHENPQAGRYREFYQMGFESVGGESDPVYDAEVIVAGARFLESLKLKNLAIQLNSIGCKTCRPNYRKKLQEFYKKEINAAKKTKVVCRDCERRLETNPLRLLDCKSEICANLKAQAPSILDNLCFSCRQHLKGVLEYLDEVGLPYSLNPYLVRGLDYYSRTVFEIFSDQSDLALMGGGRYDYLGEALSGKLIPAVGVAAGIERIIEVIKTNNLLPPKKSAEKIFVIHVGDLAKKKSFALIEQFRKENIKTAAALGKDSLQAQLKAADKEGSPFAIIIGQKEVYEESVIVRDMKTGGQETVPLKMIVETLKEKMRK